MTPEIRFRTHRSIVVPAIVAINAAVFVSWHVSAEMQKFMLKNFTVSWRDISQGHYWVLLTSVFSHNMLWHILINMMVLLSFGPPLERILGHARFLAFYLAAGILSSLSHALVSYQVLGAPDLPALGASGAIAGVILVFALVFPKEKILLFAIIPLPAIVGALGFIAIDIWGLTAQAGGGGLPIGHGAHLGGAFTGVLCFLWWRTRKHPIV
jgi:membrane associated rhomboid family serine protease